MVLLLDELEDEPGGGEFDVLLLLLVFELLLLAFSLIKLLSWLE